MDANTKTTFNISQYLSISVILTFLSQLSLLTYYNAFNFNPIFYYDATEILFFSIRDFVIVSFFLFIYLQINSVFIGPILYSGFKDASNIQKKVPGYFARNAFTIFPVVIMLTAGLTAYIKGLPYKSYFIAPTILLAVDLIKHNQRTFQKFETSHPDYYSHVNPMFPKIELPILVIGISYVMMMHSIAQVQAEQTLKYNNYIGSTFTVSESEKIKITSKCLLIGRSKEFLFIYNAPTANIRVIKRADIIKESIKAKKTDLISWYKF